MLLQMASSASDLQSAAQRDTAALTPAWCFHEAKHTSITIASMQIQIADVNVGQDFQVCLILHNVLIVQKQQFEQLQAEAALWSLTV